MQTRKDTMFRAPLYSSARILCPSKMCIPCATFLRPQLHTFGAMSQAAATAIAARDAKIKYCGHATNCLADQPCLLGKKQKVTVSSLSARQHCGYVNRTTTTLWIQVKTCVCACVFACVGQSLTSMNLDAFYVRKHIWFLQTWKGFEVHRSCQPR